MVQYLVWTLIGVSSVLSLLIMLQSKGNGLSLAPGGGDFGKFERRGPEKVLHFITMFLAVVFIGLNVAIFLLAA